MLQINQIITYTHNANIYTGKIMSIKNHEIVVIELDNDAAFQLWNLGYAIGTCISPTQIIN